MIDPGEFQDRGGGIDRLQHMHREPAFIQLQRLRPVPQRDQAVDMLVVALLVERPVDGDAPEPEHIQAGEPRRRQCLEELCGGPAQALVERSRPLLGIDRNDHDRSRRQLGRDIGFRLRQRQAAIEAAAPHRAERIALEPF